MNVQEYISSGIVESYVLGLASPEEQGEFESMCKQYPEILQARIAFEISLEKAAMDNAIAPPANLRNQIREATLSSGPARVIPMSGAPVVRNNWVKYAIAASLILLAGSLYWNISLYNNNQKLQSDYNDAVAKADTSAARLSNLEREVATLVGNPNLKLAAMKGLDPSPASFATVYWDSTSKDVYLMVNNLPKPASDKQYQLWALLDGKPIDLGMVPADYFVGEKKLLLRMKNASGAQAFAITLEKMGGNPTPQGTMYVLGNL